MKKVLSILLVFAMVMSMFTVTFAVDGDDAVIINDAAGLIAAAEEINADGAEGKYYKLGADINLNGADWTNYIGTATVPFKGTFDGNGHTVKNYKLAIPMQDKYEYFGLFGVMGGNAVIKNIGVEDVLVYCAGSWGYKAYAAALVAKMTDNAKVDSCYARNITFDKGDSNVVVEVGGGLIGAADGAGVEITNSYTTGFSEINDMVASESSFLGVLFNASKVENCYSDFNLTQCDASKASLVSNSYCLSNSGWCSYGTRPGTVVTAAVLKESHETLGAAYTLGTNYNNGYPVLTWEPAPAPISGTGSEDDPYVIKTKAHLIEASLITDSEGKYFELDADIDLESKTWTTYIGTEDATFKGIFDGKGHIIKNVVFNVPGENDAGNARVGVFGVVGGNAVIKNLGIETVKVGCNASWGYNALVGGLAGKLTDNACIDSCYVKDMVVDTKPVGASSPLLGACGAIAGYSDGEGVAIKNCISLGFKEINDCIATEDGIVGQAAAIGEITNCYSDTTVACVAPGMADKVTNSYGLRIEGWAPGEYSRVGEVVTMSQLKGMYETLGSAFKKGGIETKGLPALTWMTVTELTIAEGSGTYDDPYKIKTADDLAAMAEFTETAGVYFSLENDIDLGGEVWSTYIGTETAGFKGIFDGNGHKITNFAFDIPQGEGVNGLFAYVDGNAHIFNLGIENVTATLAQWSWNQTFGSLAGKLSGNAALTECYVKNVEFEAGWEITDQSQGQFQTAGGMFGLANGSGVEIRNCYALNVDTGVEKTTGGDDYHMIMYDGGLGGRAEGFLAIDTCYCDTYVVHYLSANYGVENCYFGKNHIEWWPNSNWAGYQTEVKYLSNLWSIKYLPYSSEIQSPTLKWEHGGYQNLVKGGYMKAENPGQLFGVPGATIINGLNYNRRSFVLDLPAPQTLTTNVALEEGKYYRVSFRGRTLSGNAADVEMMLGADNLMADITDKTLDGGWKTKVAFIKADATENLNLIISSNEELLLDDVEVIEINSEYETTAINDSIRLEHFKVESLQADMFVEDYICDGVEIKYIARDGYIGADGKLTDAIPVGFGTVNDNLKAYVDLADIHIEKDIDLVIEKIQPVDVKGVNLVNVDGKPVYDIKYADKVGKINVVNNNDEQDVTVIVAAYKDGKLSGIKTIAVTDSTSYNIDMAVNGADKIKLYAVKDNSLAPISLSEESYDSLGADDKVEIHTIGDSIVTTYEPGSTLNGWGQRLGEYFDENNLVVDNSLSRGGMYAEEFLKEPVRFATLLPKLDKNDYVFIQLTHNDAGYYDKETFKSLITQFVDGAREKGAIPVFVTSPEVFTAVTDDIGADGKYQYTPRLNGYPEALKDLAVEKDVPVIDLNAYTHELMAQYGRTQLLNMDIWVSDNVHFSPNGAKVLAEYIVSQVDELKLPIAEYILEK